jgi:hypothetical protein
MIRRALFPILILGLATALFVVGCDKAQEPATKAETEGQYAAAKAEGQCPAATGGNASCQRGDSLKCSPGQCPNACKAHTSDECTCTDAQKAACTCPHTGDAVAKSGCTCPDGKKTPCAGADGKAPAACAASTQGRTGMSCDKVCPEGQKGACPAATKTGGK